MRATGNERLIELYVGEFTGSDGGMWYLTNVYVDPTLEKEDAVAAAIEKLEATLGDTPVAFIGLYCFWEDDMVEEEDWEEEFDYDLECHELYGQDYQGSGDDLR